jgi:uncharacterized protein DUF1264
VLFDGNGRDANLIGIEYIISGRLFGTLPESEKPYWHPHNYEILSGQLAALGAARGGRASLPQAVDEQLRQDLAHLAHRPPRARARATGSRSATPSSCGRSTATARPANTSNATSSSTWRSMRPASAPTAKRSPNSPTPARRRRDGRPVHRHHAPGGRGGRRGQRLDRVDKTDLRANINLTCIMIGEHLSDWMRGQA